MSPLAFFVRLTQSSARAFVRELVRWRAKEWAAFASFVLAVVILYVEEKPIQAALELPDNAWVEFANSAGGGWPVTICGVALFVVGLFVDRKMANAVLVLAVCGLFCFTLTRALTFLFAEARPRDGGAMHFFALHGHGVSGHASAAALLLFPVRDVLLAKRRRALVTVVFVAWALFIGWSRVAMGMHHAWNVLLGWGIGFYSSRIVTETAVRDLQA